VSDEKIEAAPVTQQEWSQEDIDWLNQYVNPELRGVAMRWGRPVFTMALRIGLINHCTMTLADRLKKNPELMKMMELLTRGISDQTGLAIKGIGADNATILECKTDIERVGAMQQSTPAGQARADGKKVSPGGIILDS
jgi:hypothetical protein